MTETTLSTFEAGKILGVSPTTIRNWCQRGKIQHVMDTVGCYRIPESEIEAKLAEAIRKVPEKRLLTVRDAARMLGYTTGHVVELIKRRRIAYLPDPVRIDREDLDAFIESAKIRPRMSANTAGRI